MSRKPYKRVYCDSLSPIIKSIRTAKNHGKIRIINDLTYEQIGDDMLYCLKTSRVVKLASLE
jgi:hypothetical protein